MKTQVKPWTDARGRILSDDEIRIQSRNWCAETWEDYLVSLESKASGQSFKPEAYDGFCDDLINSIFDVVTNENNSALKKKIEGALLELPERQQEVLRLIFWEGKSQRQVATTLRIEQSCVFRLKARALNNLRISLEKIQGGIISPFMRGQENSEYLKTRCIDSDIAEVMNSEINRNATHESHWRKNK